MSTAAAGAQTAGQQAMRVRQTRPLVIIGSLRPAGTDENAPDSRAETTSRQTVQPASRSPRWPFESSLTLLISGATTGVRDHKLPYQQYLGTFPANSIQPAVVGKTKPQAASRAGISFVTHVVSPAYSWEIGGRTAINRAPARACPRYHQCLPGPGRRCIQRPDRSDAGQLGAAGRSGQTAEKKRHRWTDRHEYREYRGSTPSSLMSRAAAGLNEFYRISWTVL